MTHGRAGHALVLGDGDPPDRADLDRIWSGWDRDVTLVVAADGGARLAEQLGLSIDRWIGDADSFPREEVDRLAASGIWVNLVSTAKDESDLELAVIDAALSNVREITILGALGGSRIDHELANVVLLAHPALREVSARLLDPWSRISLLTAPDEMGREVTGTFRGRAGDVISLLPISANVSGLTTKGLAYPLFEEALTLGPARGLSNVRTEATATVSVRDGRLLVIESPATLRP